MNKKERVMSVIHGEHPDRIPAAFWLHFPEGNEWGEASVKTHLHFFEESHTDLCKVMNENSLPDNPEIVNPEDWAKVNPIPHDADFIKRQLELTKRVCAEVNGEAVVLATVHGMVASAFHWLGGQTLYDNDKQAITRHLRSNPEDFHHGMVKIADYLEYLCKESIRAGADGIYFASLGGEKAMMTDEEFETFIKPYEIRILNSVQQVPCFNALHMCKDNLNLNRYINYPVQVLNWGVWEDNLSLTEGLELFGRDKILMGGLDDRAGVLVEGTDAEIAEEVQKVLREVGTDRFFLGADCTLPTDIAYSRICAAVDALEK